MLRGSFYQRLSAFYFSYFAFIGAFAPYFALYLKSLGYSAAQIGLLLAVNPVARIFGPNLWGWLSDHYRARGLLIRLTAVGTAVVFTAVFFNHGFAWMFTALLLLNVFWCGVLPLAESATLSLVGSRVGAYGRVRLWGSVGFVAGGNRSRLRARFFRHSFARSHRTEPAGPDGSKYFLAAPRSRTLAS
jgi:PPP family 3-phenylpropionic acid transporter